MSPPLKNDADKLPQRETLHQSFVVPRMLARELTTAELPLCAAAGHGAIAATNKMITKLASVFGKILLSACRRFCGIKRDWRRRRQRGIRDRYRVFWLDFRLFDTRHSLAEGRFPVSPFDNNIPATRPVFRALRRPADAASAPEPASFSFPVWFGAALCLHRLV